MIDTATEQIFSLQQFAFELKRQRGIERTYSAIRDWARNGWSPRGQTEPVIKLETIPLCGVEHTSFGAFDRFLEAQAEAKHSAEAAS